MLSQAKISVLPVGKKEIATFLLENGAGFSSYTLMDHPDFSRELLRQRLLETTPGAETSGTTEEVSVRVSHCSNPIQFKSGKDCTDPWPT